MSVWNRIGDIATTTAKNTAKFGGELVGAAGSTARLLGMWEPLLGMTLKNTTVLFNHLRLLQKQKAKI